MKSCTVCFAEFPLDNFYGKSANCKPCFIAKQVQYRRRNWRAHRCRTLQRQYGITLEAYEALLASQGGKCAFCRTPADEAPRGQLFVDHCHDSGAVRWLLCHQCNVGLGMFKDSPELLRIAADRIESHVLS